MSGDLQTLSTSFGELLRTYRKRKRLTQRQLAQQLGVQGNTISSWELGTYLPATRGLVLELARYLTLDEPETRYLLEASLTALSPHWSVPLLRNPYFTGREEILEALHTQLGIDQAVALTRSSALHGLGGVGKTQIALEYAYRYALEYSAIFWIGAETEEQIVSSLLRVASVLHLPEQADQDQQRVIAAVQRWLSTHGHWLVIWDNVEDLVLLDRFLPSARSGATLLTTQSPVLGTWAYGLDLAPMKLEEGLLFLLRRAKILVPEAGSGQLHQFAEQHSASYASATQLVEALGGLPLALDQAGAYLEATHCGVSAYLDLFCSRRFDLLRSRGERAHDHPASVSTTFMLALASAIERYPVVGDLLRVCALLQPDAIPEELFRQGAKMLGPDLKTVCSDPLEWDRLIVVACSSSLLCRYPEEQTLSLHRLVQAVLLDTMTESQLEIWNRRTLAALSAAFPNAHPTAASTSWQQSDRFLPHALLCLRRVGFAEEALTYKVAQHLLRRGQYAEAEPLFWHVLALREQTQGPDHSHVASALNYLALLSWEQGKYAQAEPLYQRALFIYEQTQGADPLDMASTLNNLANLYWSQGKYAQAETLHQLALSIYEQTQGADPLDVARALSNLASLYGEQGKYAQAEPLLQHALSISEQTLGPDHHLVAFYLNNLAECFVEQSKYVEAEALHQRARALREQALGPDHPLVAFSLSNLASVYTAQGKYTEAEPLYRRALALREQHLGHDHPETAQTLHDLALFHQKQGNLSEAIFLVERALTIRSQSLGDSHRKTIATHKVYAQLSLSQVQAQKETRRERNMEGEPMLLERGEKEEEPQQFSSHSSVNDDPLQNFLDACCELHPRAWCRSADLWQAYERWSRTYQERYPLSRTTFTQQLKALGCRADRTNSARIWRGITVVNRETVTDSDRE